MGKKLPVFEDSRVDEMKAVRKKPSVDAARTRLGGRLAPADIAPAGFAPGVVVRFESNIVGVVVYGNESEIHVLLDGVRLRRAAPHDVQVHDGSPGIELEKLAADARLFGLVVEGQAVRYADDTGLLVDGKVAEKCRWGALVLRGDDSVVAVGFRKLWPIPPRGAM